MNFSSVVSQTSSGQEFFYRHQKNLQWEEIPILIKAQTWIMG